MQQTNSRTAALIEGAVSDALELVEELHEFSNLCGSDEATQTKVQAWKNAIAAQRDLVRLAVSRGRR